MPLLQLLGPQRDELLNLLILSAERGGECLLTSGKVLLLGVQLGMLLMPSGLVLGGLRPRLVLGLLDVVLLHDKLQLALGQQVLGNLQLLMGLAKPSL